MSKSCQNLDIFFKKIAKNCLFFFKLQLAIFLKKMKDFGNFLKFFQVFVNFWTVKWQLSGGSEIYLKFKPLPIERVLRPHTVRAAPVEVDVLQHKRAVQAAVTNQHRRLLRLQLHCGKTTAHLSGKFTF